jgi:hypothetical protein
MGDRPQGSADTTVEVANDQQQGEQRDPFERERYGQYGEGDRTARALETGDRAAFRQQCEQMLTGFKGDLRAANDAMKIVNMDGERGIRPGTVPYNQHFDAAKQAYFKAIDKSNNMLYETDAQGNRKIDPVTGRPKESQLNLAIQQERRLLNDEIVALDQVVKANRPLNAEEMRKLGVNNPDARVALEQKLTQDQMLKDLQRSSGYAQANFGLALMRSSVNLQGPDKARQQEAGQLLLEKASQDDPWMLGPPPDDNYLKHKRRVLGIIDASNAPAAQGDPRIGPDGQRPQDTGNGGDGSARPGAPQVVQGQDGRRYIKEGTYTLPVGDVAPNSQNFRNPFDILRQVEATVTAAPLTPQQMQGFEDAIKVADSLDRAAIRAQIQQNEEVMARMKADRTLGPKINHAEQQIRSTQQALQSQQGQLNQMFGPLAQAGGGAVLNQLGQFKTVEELNAWRTKPENRAAVQQFEGLANGQGAAFISVLSQFLNTRKIAEQQEALLNTPELKPYNDARKSNQLLSALYQSSIDTRAHYVKALTADGHLNEQTKPRAVQLMQELAVMDTNLPNDEAFKATKAKLGMPADQPQATVPGDATLPRPGDATNPTGQQTAANPVDAAMDTLQRKFDAAPDKRAAMQQLQPEYVQLVAMADQAAASIIPQAIAANQALKPQLDAAIPADKAQRLQQLGAQLDTMPIKPEHQALVTELVNPQTTQQRRTELTTQLDGLYPQRAAVRKEMEAIMAPGLPIMQQMDQNTLNVRAALARQYQTRMMTADAYVQAGDLVNGKKFMIEGLSKLLPEDRAATLQNPKVIELANKVGLQQAEIPTGPGGIPAGTDTAAGGTQPGAQPGQTGDAAATQAAIEAFAKANQAIERQDLAGAKPHFEEAIKQADKSVNYEQSAARIRDLQKALKENSFNGQQLKFDDRLVLHGLIAQEIEKMELPLKARATYARELRKGGQYADAERIIKETVATSDKMPVGLLRDHVALIGQDLQNPDLNLTQNAQKKELLKTFAQQLQGTKPDEGYINLQINTRKDMAAFYMGLRVDERGNAAVGTTIFKPEEAMKALDEAKAKYKEMGIDLDANPGRDPMLTQLSKLTLEHSPKELKEKYTKGSRFFDNAVSDTAAAITGAAAVGITAAALLSRGKSLGPTTKALLAVEGIAVASLTRAGVHQLMTGEGESIGTSLVHGTAAVGSLGLLYASKGQLANFYARNASAINLGARWEAGTFAQGGSMTMGNLRTVLGRSSKPGMALADDAAAFATANPLMAVDDVAKLQGLKITDDVATAAQSQGLNTLGDVSKAIEGGTFSVADDATRTALETLGKDPRLAQMALTDASRAAQITLTDAQLAIAHSGKLGLNLHTMARMQDAARLSGTSLPDDLAKFAEKNPALSLTDMANLQMVGLTDDMIQFATTNNIKTIGELQAAVEKAATSTTDDAAKAAVEATFNQGTRDALAELAANPRLANQAYTAISDAGRVQLTNSQWMNLTTKLDGVAANDRAILEAMHGKYVEYATAKGIDAAKIPATADQMTAGHIRELANASGKMDELVKAAPRIVGADQQTLVSSLLDEGLAFGKNGSPANKLMEGFAGIERHHWWSVPGLKEKASSFGSYMGANLNVNRALRGGPIDAATASSHQLAAAQNWTAYGSSLAGIGAYSNATNLWDYGGEKGFLGTLAYTNLGVGAPLGAADSVFFKALYLTPFNRAGAIGGTIRTPGAGAWRTGFDLANGTGVARGAERLAAWSENATVNGLRVGNRTIVPGFSLAPVTAPAYYGGMTHVQDVLSSYEDKAMSGYYKNLLEQSQQPVRNRPLVNTQPLVPGDPSNGGGTTTDQGGVQPQADQTTQPGATPLLPGQMGVGDSQQTSQTEVPPEQQVQGQGPDNPYVDGTQR